MKSLASSGLPLAPRIFPERPDETETALDRRLNGLIRRVAALLPQRSDRDFVHSILAHEAELREYDDGRLRTLARSSAANAFIDRDRAAGARVLATVREAGRRTVGLAAHPPQLLSAWKLLRGRLVELDTGEGKTLAAGLAACVAALAGIPTHVVTVNDYLAQRDARLMGPLFAFFGLSVGVVHAGVAQGLRAAEYERNITYCTNKDLVFDYLRDRVNARGIVSLAQLAVRQLHAVTTGTGEPLRLRGLHFAIVDEADSILIDEGRTPLILSSARGQGRDEEAFRALLELAGTLEQDEHFEMVGSSQVPQLTPRGREHLADVADSKDSSAEVLWHVPWVREHYVVQALRAMHVLRRDHHYVVQEGKVVIVDEFTGRLLPDRTWEQGLHQLVEVKEGCAVTGANRTLARLTYQTFFARYLRLSGMSGTLREVAGEIAAVYRVSTERVEPHRPVKRVTWPSLLLASEAEKHRAVVAEVSECLSRGQPVLVGTRSVQASVAVSNALTTADIPHRVLNALQTADEADLVARAGGPGAVTVATNMAGRGTDIPVDPAVIANGGLHVVLTEWHESARIDRQLFGRCARQGDPGSCRAIVSLQDEIIQRHASVMGRWLARRWAGRTPPQWAVTLLRRRTQANAGRENEAQRRATMQQDRQMQTQLAFSGTAE
jgi:preprotein translocase subunit SecA